MPATDKVHELIGQLWDDIGTKAGPIVALTDLDDERVQIHVLGGAVLLATLAHDGDRVGLRLEPAAPSAPGPTSALDACNCCEAAPAADNPAGYCGSCLVAAQLGLACWHDAKVGL
jgi:hypothetical protein